MKKTSRESKKVEWAIQKTGSIPVQLKAEVI